MAPYHHMDYIKDRSLYKAVMYARKLIRTGTSPAAANTHAANYYSVSVHDVAHYTGQVASSISSAKRKKRLRHHNSS